MPGLLFIVVEKVDLAHTNARKGAGECGVKYFETVTNIFLYYLKKPISFEDFEIMRSLTNLFAPGNFIPFKQTKGSYDEKSFRKYSNY